MINVKKFIYFNDLFLRQRQSKDLGQADRKRTRGICTYAERWTPGKPCGYLDAMVD